MIEYGLPLWRDLAAAIRRHRPELVVTVNHRETYAAGERFGGRPAVTFELFPM